jgi:hypothetical protein
MDSNDRSNPSTPPASAGLAASRTGEGVERPAGVPSITLALEGIHFRISDRVTRAMHGMPYQRRPDQALYRPLRIFSLDPSASRREGAIAVVNVPYERLQPGPKGYLLEVIDEGLDGEPRPGPVDLDDERVLLEQGHTPSATDPLFRPQMAYAVCSTTYAAFRQALGRDVSWGFRRDPDSDGHDRLRIRSCCDGSRNAFYDAQQGEIQFGAYRADEVVEGRNLPCGVVCTSLLHDVVVHEMSHALLDGLRARFLYPSNPDVLAFHEAFSDLVAIFQRFTYRDVVRAGLRHARGDVRDASLLTDLGRMFGETTGRRRSLRSAVLGTNRRYQDSSEAHERGEVLLAAVFRAYSDIYHRKALRMVKLATNGTGVLPVGEIPADLADLLTETACRLAAHFLSICIRAIDYCPPVDITFGEYLRAVITADADLVPDDTWSYREAWIDAFRHYGIYPSDVTSLSEDSLLWRGPDRALPPTQALSFAQLRFRGDPGCPADESELRRQAVALGKLIVDPDHAPVFGLLVGNALIEGATPDLPVVESIRTSRRVGPSGQVVFDLVAEVTQRLVVPATEEQAGFEFFGGATIIFDPTGQIRYVIRKGITHRGRLAAQRAFLEEQGESYFTTGPERRLLPHAQPFRFLHDPEE